MKTKRCYIYTRVSTSMQVDGYSLDAQKDKLKKYAEFQDMVRRCVKSNYIFQRESAGKPFVGPVNIVYIIAFT